MLHYVVGSGLAGVACAYALVRRGAKVRLLDAGVTRGTFPMSERPAATQTDVLGRPAGWHRVHAVDATVLPSIPPTTITFSVMANAHRIGWLSANHD